MIDRACAGPGAHDIPEVNHWNQVWKWDSWNQPLVESSSVNTGGGL